MLRRFITPEVGDVRFTQTDDAFYILSLSKPSETFVVSAPLPILEGDLITMVGAGNNTQMSWVAEEDGISITVPSALSDASKYCWVFKIAYSP
jgi:alpha-L-fucosidase